MRLVLTLALLLTPVFAQQNEHKAPEQKAAEQQSAAPAGEHKAEEHKAEEHKAAEHKAEGHEGGESHGPGIGWMWANFLILGGALGFLISKNAGPFFKSRTEEIQSELQEARKLRADSEARVSEIEKKVANLQSEMQSLRDHAKAEMDAEAQRIQQETARAIDKIRASAENEIAFASKLAQQELKAFSAELSLKLATGMIRERLTPAKQEELANGFVQQLANSQKVTH